MKLTSTTKNYLPSVVNSVKSILIHIEKLPYMEENYALTSSVLSLLKSKLEQFGSKTALCTKNGDKWQNLSYAELGQRACNLANYLIESGIQSGDRIAILSESRPEWSIGLFAGILSGAIVVPLDTKLSETELNSILTDCFPRILFTSLSNQNVADKLKSSVVSIEQVLTLEEVTTDSLSSRSIQPQDILQFKERQMDEVASIIYTSGTTGKPKGVKIAFRNLIFEAETLGQVVGAGPDDSFLSILPLNHLLELSGGLLSVLYAGGTVCYAQSLYPQDILHLIQKRKITGILGVPLFFKTLYNSIQKEVNSTPLKRLWFRTAMTLAQKLPWQITRRIIFFPLHQKFGGKMRIFISGGAPLDVDVANFFQQIGLPIIQGYGLTETGPVICVNTPTANRIGSVGKPLPGVEVKIDFQEKEQTQGEVLTRGPHVMKGYYKSEKLTREVLDRDGWFRTGDLGVIDANGFLHITGRIKNLIVLGDGKKVNPEEVEAVLSKSPSIQEICVVGRSAKHGIKKDTEEVCAVVVPSDSLKQQLQTPDTILAEIEQEIANLLMNLASYKRPSRIFMHLEGLPKTSSRKIKRPLVLEWLNTLE